MEEALIRVKDLCKIYNPGENEVRALDHINLEINKGEFVAIIGQSGSGKSTFMNMLGCLDVPTSGEYFLNGTDVSTMEDNELSEVRNREIGFIFQGFNLISNLTAIENVELPLVYRGVDRKTRHKLAVESLTMVGLEKRMDHRPNEMSGGQQQRVAIARAIAAQPPVILADEPTGNLDSASSKEILQILKSMHEQGKTVILITHDNGIAAQARRVVRIMDGKIESDFINKNYGKEEYIKNLKDLLNADIIIRKLKKGLLAKEIFEYVKDSGTDYTYTGDGYTITLVGNNAYTPGEMKNGISMKEEGSGLTFTMAESGNLPGTVNVTIRTSLSTGTYDMYQNDNGTLKKLNQIFVKDGKFTCSVSKGGTYDLKKVGTDAAEETALLGTKSAAPAETETSSNNKSTSSTSSGISGSNIKNSTEESSTIKAEVKDGVVAAKAFEDIKGRNKNLKMTGKTVDGKEYTLTINGKDVKKTVDMKIGVTTKSDNQEDIKKLAGDPYILHFEQSGEFPGIMLVEIPIEKSDGDYLLFYYNKEERKAEYIQRVVIKDKKTKFLVSKGGDYFIDKKAKVKSLNDTNEEKKKIKTDTAAANSISDMKEEPVLAGTMEVQPEKGSFPVLSIVIIVLGCGGIAAAVVMLRKRRH